MPYLFFLIAVCILPHCCFMVWFQWRKEFVDSFELVGDVLFPCLVFLIPCSVIPRIATLRRFLVLGLYPKILVVCYRGWNRLWKMELGGWSSACGCMIARVAVQTATWIGKGSRRACSNYTFTFASYLLSRLRLRSLYVCRSRVVRRVRECWRRIEPGG